MLIFIFVFLIKDFSTLENYEEVNKFGRVFLKILNDVR